MTDTKTMPDCWVVVLDGQIIGTNDERTHLEYRLLIEVAHSRITHARSKT